MDPKKIWEPIRLDVNKVSVEIQGIKAAYTNAKRLISCTRKLVHNYFYSYRPIIIAKGISVDSVDLLMQDLFKLTNSRSSIVKYKSLVKSLKKQFSTLEIESLLILSKEETEQTGSFTSLETAILQTLEKIAPEIAISYSQILTDLADQNRISFRGSAAEIREVLRGVLEVLAPDSEVEKTEGFKYEKDTNRPGKFLTSPTMKQKVRFILKSRGKSSGSMKAPEDAVLIVEELISSFTRSIYTRGSVATHTEDGAGKEELQKLKLYVDTVLCELLEIKF